MTDHLLTQLRHVSRVSFINYYNCYCCVNQSLLIDVIYQGMLPELIIFTHDDTE